jgi:nicotinate phosphoribosyltransferase
MAKDDGERRPLGLHDIYRPSLALLTDLYQLTMAYGYWKSGTHEKEAVFHLFFRQNPFQGGFTLACGLTRALELIERLRFDEEDLAYLATLAGNDGQPLFDAGFLQELRAMRFACDVDAIPEGTIVFPHEPLLRIRGPILQGQLLETALLNVVNFETLIATKAARIGIAAKGDPVLEFGLRRAQGIDGGLAASWAAYVGGVNATSNVLAGRLFGIPVRGTHAHSWVMSFEDELASFEAYAEAMPNNAIFLVDTYDTLAGVDKAIAVGRRLRERGHEMAGIRLDSGDLAYLSVEARRKLDAGGFKDAIIVASNDLDEHLIASLRGQGAAIDAWGVGTRLVTGHDQPALGGVYKLSAVRSAGAPWRYTVKLSEQAIKINNPGILQVRRYEANGEYAADVIYDEERGVQDPGQMIDPADLTRRKALPAGPRFEDLLVPVFRGGRRVYDSPSIHAIRDRAQAQLAGFHAGIKRFVNPHRYPVGLEGRLFDLKTELVLKARGLAPQG